MSDIADLGDDALLARLRYAHRSLNDVDAGQLLDLEIDSEAMANEVRDYVIEQLDVETLVAEANARGFDDPVVEELDAVVE